MAKITKAAFIAGIQKRGTIDVGKLPTSGTNEWYRSEHAKNIYCYNASILIIISKLDEVNPPVDESAITFQDYVTYADLEEIDETWALSVIDKLPIVGVSTQKTVTFSSIPTDALFAYKHI